MKHFLYIYLLTYVNFFFLDDDDDESTDIEDVHISNMKSNVIVGDNQMKMKIRGKRDISFVTLNLYF